MIYVASRASIPARDEMWRRLRDEYHWPIISSWIDEAVRKLVQPLVYQRALDGWTAK